MTSATYDTAGIGAVSRPLTTVLTHLGHECHGTCARAIDELGAQLWFVRRRPLRHGRRLSTLVVVDASEYDGPRERARRLLGDINDCLRPDGLRMSERRIDDAGLALATVLPMTRDRVRLRPMTSTVPDVGVPPS